MIKKIISIVLLVSIIEICLGGILVSGTIKNTSNISSYWSILQIILGSFLLISGLYTYAKTSLKNVYLYILVIFLNLIMSAIITLINIANIVIPITLALSISLLVVLVFKRITKI